MREFLPALFLSILIFIALPLLLPNPVYATHLGNGFKDQCVDYNVSQDCTRLRTICKNLDGSVPCDTNTCHYNEASYECDNESVPNTKITCLQRSPIDCGPGVTVCGPGGDYTCYQWCSDNWENSVSKDSTKYRATNPYRCQAPFTYSDKTCYMNACLSGPNQECTNAQSTCISTAASSTCSANACPGSAGHQCDQSHSCVYQPTVSNPQYSAPPACSVSLSASTTSITSGDQVTFSWTTTNADTSRKGFGTQSFQGIQPYPQDSPYPPMTLTTDPDNPDQERHFFAQV